MTTDGDFVSSVRSRTNALTLSLHRDRAIVNHGAHAAGALYVFLLVGLMCISYTYMDLLHSPTRQLHMLQREPGECALVV